MYFVKLSLITLFVCTAAAASGQIAGVPYCGSEITIDGQFDDWNHYHKSVFMDTLRQMHTAPGRSMMAFFDDSYDYSKIWIPLSRNNVEVWICWDMDCLYFAFHVNDRHLFSEIEPAGKTPHIHMNDGIEIYIDARDDSDSVMDINDYQLLFDVSGNSLVFRGDQELLERDTVSIPKTTGQNIYYEFAVNYSGTLNDTLDDNGFVAEIAIPFSAIGLKPTTGLKMNMDICCNDIDYSFAGTKTYDEKSLRYWSFNWVGISDFGYPETWLEVQLTGAPGWWDKMSGAKMRRWFVVYASALAITLLVIITLVLRMRKVIRLPAREDIPAPKIVILERQPSQATSPDLSANEMILKKATDFITENSTENIHTENLARALGITIRKLQRITQEELQTTPTNFIYLIKLHLAASYLKSRKGNVSETAYEFGFSDPGYFSKLFKRHFGLSPLEYLDKNDDSMENTV
jgi:AraC-like DNA-binding protein